MPEEKLVPDKSPPPQQFQESSPAKKDAKGREGRRAPGQELLHILERVTDGFVALDKDWKFAYVNPKAAELLDKSIDDLLNQHVWTMFPESVGTEFYTAAHRSLTEQIPLRQEAYYPLRDCWFEVHIYPSPDGLSIFFRDVTGYKRDAEKLHRTNRALMMLSECNRALVHAAEKSTFLNQICRTIVEVGGYCMAWVGFAEEDEKKTVRPLAQVGYEADYLETLNLTWADTPRGRGPAGRAIRSGKPVISKNILADPTFALWREEASRRGYASIIAIPLSSQENVFGVLMVYAAELDAFDAEEVKLLTSLADDLAYGILSLRIQEEHRQAEEALRKSEEMYRKIVETAGEGIWMIDENSRTTFVNHRMAEMLGYMVEEMMGKSLFDFMDEEGRAIAAANVERRRQGIAEQHDFKFCRRNGTDLWTLISTEPVFSKEGNYKGALGMITDITERKLAEKILQQSERELRYLSTQLLMAEEKERKRIAQELHDGIGQSLSAIKFRMEYHLQKLTEAPREERIQSLNIIVSMVQQTVEEVRRTCMALRPSILDDLGILATLAWFCREFQESYPAILVHQEIQVPENEIPLTLRIVIYRIVQETFNNIARHSEAKQVNFTLQKKGNSLELLIRDDGRGFDVKAAMSADSFRRGLGLPGMRERVELSEGTFVVESAPGAGTKIKASWPVEREEK